MTTFVKTVQEGSLEKIVQVNQGLSIHLYFNVANLQKLIARNACMLTLINLRATSPTQHFAFVVSVYVGKSCLRLSLFYCYEYYSCGSYVLFQRASDYSQLLFTCKHFTQEAFAVMHKQIKHVNKTSYLALGRPARPYSRKPLECYSVRCSVKQWIPNIALSSLHYSVYRLQLPEGQTTIRWKICCRRYL